MRIRIGSEPNPGPEDNLDIGTVEVALAVAAAGFFLFTAVDALPAAAVRVFPEIAILLRIAAGFIFYMAAGGAVLGFGEYMKARMGPRTSGIYLSIAGAMWILVISLTGLSLVFLVVQVTGSK